MDLEITKNEYDSAWGAVEKILSTPVGDIEFSEDLPLIDDISDSNKVYKGKLSMMFVDMRGSTDLTDELKSKRMVKVYRSFIRLVIQAIRYSGGQARYFAGDGVMGVFKDNIDSEQTVASSSKAVQAARYINTLVDYILNPCLSKYMPDMPEIRIGCGVGICTGEIMVAKVGMRGNETDDAVENELGLVWVGSTTNYASRLCGLANPREIFIDEETFAEIGSPAGWEKVSRTKGTKVFDGYVRLENYLELPEGAATPIKSEQGVTPEDNFIAEILQTANEKTMALTDELAKKSAELSVALENVKKREGAVTLRENKWAVESSKLAQLQNKLDKKEIQNKNDEYSLYKGIFSNTFCKRDLIESLGKDYWLDLINQIVELGAKLGKSELDVKCDLAHYLVDIYYEFEMYYEAYASLCNQAEFSSWIHAHTVEKVVKKSQHWYRLREILEKRMAENNDFSDCLEKLKSMGY